MLWKLLTLIYENVVSFKFAIWFQYIAHPWSYLEKIGGGAIIWSIHHILAWIFSKMCFAIGLIAPGCWCYTHNVIICIATHLWKSIYCEGSNFQTFSNLLVIDYLHDWNRYLCQTILWTWYTFFSDN